MKNKFRIGLLFMAAVGLVGCADKLADEGGLGQLQGEDSENYVAFKISTIGSETRATRADEKDTNFDEGVADEHAITSLAGANVVYFFNQGGDFITSTPLEVLGQTNDSSNDKGHEDNGVNNQKEKIYQARIKTDRMTEISQCLLVMNGVPEVVNSLPYGENDRKLLLDEVLGKIQKTKELKKNERLGWLVDGDVKYFTMTNTVYVDGENNIKTATSIDPATQIRPTMAEAQKNPIVVHVERVLVKYSLDDTEFKGPESKITLCSYEPEKGGGDAAESPNHYNPWKTEDVKWEVNITGWGVNATEKETFWFKNMTNNEEKLNDWKFGQWDKNYDLNISQIGWNDLTRLRSYWAVDPHYNGATVNGELGETSENYPHQYRNALDDETIVSGNNNSNNNDNYVLNYYSYNDLIGDTPNDSYGNHNGEHRYSVENTFDYSGQDGWFEVKNEEGHQFEGNDYKRTATHVVIGAELLIDGSKTAKTLYQYDSYYWEATENEDKYDDMSDDLKRYMLEKIIFNWSLGEGHRYKKLYKDLDETAEFTSADYDFFEIVPATVKGGDGRVMMQLKSGKNLHYTDDSGMKQTISSTDNTNYDEFLKNYLCEYGTARRFGDGKMYYYTPIKHMYPTLDKEGKHYYSVGSYGVVRNHWYKVKIKSILNPGIPVDEPDQPIIPNDDPDEDAYAAFEVVIQPWHVIETETEF